GSARRDRVHDAVRLHPRRSGGYPSRRRRPDARDRADRRAGDLGARHVSGAAADLASWRSRVQRGRRLMRRYLRIAAMFLRTEVQYAMAYRANFAFGIVRLLIVVGTSIGAALILFQYTDAMNGWTLPQMIALLGVYYVVQGLGDLMFLPSVTKLMEQV